MSRRADPPAARPHPRRILFVTYEFPPVGGGLGKATRNLARSMAAQGYDVAVLTALFRDLPREEEQLGFRVLRIPVLRRHLNYANAYEVLSFAISGIMRRRWLLERFQPDATIALLTIPSGIVAEALRRRTGTPWLNFLRGQDVPGFPDTPAWMHKLAWPVTSFLWRHCHRIMANSQGLADLARQSAPNLDVVVIPNIIDTHTYRPPDEPRRNDRVRVLYLGRLVAFKRLHELVDGWKMLVERAGVPVELCLGGYGPEREALESLAAQAGLADSVRFLGRLDEADVVAALREADIFINPSSGEGLPNAVQEAMACGLPVALSDIAPHRELLVGGQGGVMFDGASPEAIAGALLPLVESHELRERMGTEARRIILENFSADRVTRMMIDLLRE